MDLRWLGEFDRVYCYARVSSKDQADKRQSIETQKARLLGITPRPDRLYEDKKPGDNADRPDYILLMDQIRDDALSGLKVLLVITELSRLSRDKNVTDTIEFLESLNVVLFALDGGNITVLEPHSWLARSQEAMFNQYFLKQLCRNLRSSKAQKRVERKPLNPRPPVGYLWSKERYLIDNDKLPLLRQLVTHYLPPPQGSGWSLRQCAAWAKEQGLKLTRPNSVSAWLVNPVIRGHLAYSIGGHNRAEQKLGTHRKPKEIAYNTHEPIITEAEYQTIQKRLKENQQYARSGTNKPRYPLSGLVYCGYCGVRMTYHTTVDPRYKRRYGNYLCREPSCTKQSVSARTIETAVRQAIATQAPQLVALLALPIEDKINPELLKVQQQLQELRSLYERTPLSGLREAIAELEQKAIRLEKVTEGVPDIDFTGLLALYSEPETFNLLSLPEKRQVYHELVAKVIVKRAASIDVTLHF